MPKFKIGDRVKRTEGYDFSAYGMAKNSEHIVSYCDENDLQVEGNSTQFWTVENFTLIQSGGIPNSGLSPIQNFKWDL